jgi:hypothetical protein
MCIFILVKIQHPLRYAFVGLSACSSAIIRVCCSAASSWLAQQSQIADQAGDLPSNVDIDAQPFAFLEITLSAIFSTLFFVLECWIFGYVQRNGMHEVPRIAVKGRLHAIEVW